MCMCDTTYQFWNERTPENFDMTTKRSGRIEAISKMAAIAKPYLSRKNAVTIDLGCGTGLFAAIAGLKTIIGIDFSIPLLKVACQRMQTVLQQSIFAPGFVKKSVDNVVSLFVIDDYPTEKKREFFMQIWSLMRPGGRVFFAAYSPNDERMGPLKETVNAQSHMEFTIYLESAASYEAMFQEVGFLIEHTELLTTPGVYAKGMHHIPVTREFILMVAEKPRNL